MSRIRVYLVNDNRLVRESVKRLFQLTSDIGLVGAAATAEIAIEELSRVSADILLMQCNLSEGGRPCPLQQVKACFPRVRVLMFGMSKDYEALITAIRYGATGYLLRDASTDEILAAVRALHRDEAVIPQCLSLALVEFAAGVRTYPIRSAHEIAAGLTIREHQLVPLIAARLTNKQIADRLGISEQTVKNHVRKILRKLNVRHRCEISEQLLQANLGAGSAPHVD